ncbi:hypothetical protein ACJJTC_018059 [Scirpophaga incertulas]
MHRGKKKRDRTEQTRIPIEEDAGIDLSNDNCSETSGQSDTRSNQDEAAIENETEKFEEKVMEVIDNLSARSAAARASSFTALHVALQRRFVGELLTNQRATLADHVTRALRRGRDAERRAAAALAPLLALQIGEDGYEDFLAEVRPVLTATAVDRSASIETRTEVCSSLAVLCYLLEEDITEIIEIMKMYETIFSGSYLKGDGSVKVSGAAVEEGVLHAAALDGWALLLALLEAPLAAHTLRTGPPSLHRLADLLAAHSIEVTECLSAAGAAGGAAGRAHAAHRPALAAPPGRPAGRPQHRVLLALLEAPLAAHTLRTGPPSLHRLADLLAAHSIEVTECLSAAGAAGGAAGRAHAAHRPALAAPPGRPAGRPQHRGNGVFECCWRCWRRRWPRTRCAPARPSLHRLADLLAAHSIEVTECLSAAGAAGGAAGRAHAAHRPALAAPPGRPAGRPQHRGNGVFECCWRCWRRRWPRTRCAPPALAAPPGDLLAAHSIEVTECLSAAGAAGGAAGRAHAAHRPRPRCTAWPTCWPPTASR